MPRTGRKVATNAVVATEGSLAAWRTKGILARCQARSTAVGKTKHGKGSKIMVIADRQGLLIAVHVESATRIK